MPTANRPRWSHALLLLAALCTGCGEEDPDDGGTSVDAGLDSAIPKPDRYEATLVPVTSTDAAVFIAVPHEISLLDDNGNQLVPPVSTTSGPQGEISLPVPADAISIYAIGVGPIDQASSTYDTIIVNYNWLSGDNLLRISSRATLNLAAQFSGFTAREDRAAMAGQIYWTVNHARVGTVGCAKVYIDGAQAPDEDQAQRYIGPRLIPVSLAEQSQTTQRGNFYFGNLKVGSHTLRVSLDGGGTFIHQQDFFVGRPRAAAQSPTKSVLYQIGLDIEAAANPTLADCPP